MPKPNPIDQFAERFAASVADETFVRLILSNPLPTEREPGKVLARLVELKNGLHLSLTLRYLTRDETQNLAVSDAPDWMRKQLPAKFRSALLGTTRQDWQLFVEESGEAKLVGHKPASSETPSRAHDQTRERILDDSARDWLHGLGVVDANGKVRVSMADKHSQIDRYLEIFTHLAKDCGWTGEAAVAAVYDRRSESEPTTLGGHRPPLQRGREVVFADMGCGKGYLTFGLWHLLHRVWNQPVRVIGVEKREDLVKTTNDLALKIGARGLEFVAGTIESAHLPRVDGLIALHACNTATDDAIRRGIELGAQLIVVAPCCHKEVRPQLGKPEPLAPVLEHGIMAERMAEWATDGLRALFLEWAGYRTKVFEFVPSEHTPKNLMIAAIRKGEPFTSKAARERIEQFKAFFGIKHHALDSLLVGSDPRADRDREQSGASGGRALPGSK